MRQSKGYYDYDRNYGTMHGMNMKFSTTLVSSEGASYHLWVPRSFIGLNLETMFEKFQSCSRNLGDPVAFSWDWVPKYQIVENMRKFVVEDRETKISFSTSFSEYYKAQKYQERLEAAEFKKETENEQGKI